MLPLDGLLVVSLEHAIAAPLATRHLADLGARVIKIERPEGGDFARAVLAALAERAPRDARARALLLAELRRVCRDGPVFNMQEAVGW